MGALSTTFGERESVIALDASTGRTVWEHAYTPLTFDRLDPSYGRGPHSTPLLPGARVYSVGTTGRLVCLDRERGSLVWSHELWRDFGGFFIVNGYASSPIAYNDTIIVQAGGTARSLVAFDAMTEAVRWQAHNFRNSSSSPVLISVGGTRQLLAYMHNEVVGIDPAGGALLWRHPVRAAMDFHFNIATPLWGRDNLLFVFIRLWRGRPRPRALSSEWKDDDAGAVAEAPRPRLPVSDPGAHRQGPGRIDPSRTRPWCWRASG